MSLRIAYMTGEYPRATDTFIQREVAALRLAGIFVESMSIRKPAEKENIGKEQKEERLRTRFILPPGFGDLLKSHLTMFFASPGRYLWSLRTALFVRAPGAKSLVWQLAYFAEAGMIAAHLRRLGISHVHNHFSNSSCSATMIAAEMGNFTFSITIHGPAEFFEPKYWRMDEKIRRSLFVNCISHFSRSQAMIFAPRDKWNRIHIVHCGVDPDLFGRVVHQGKATRLLFVGRLAGVKGLPVLLEALASLRHEHPDLILTVAGDGPERAGLERQARDSGIGEQVKFLGYQSQSQVRELFSQTDIFVMASFAEGVPVVLMESLAAAVPVVATLVAGVPELVEDGVVGGYLVPPGDPKSLAKRIADLLPDAGLRQRLGDAGREKVAAEFNITTESRRMVKILSSALAGEVVETRPAPADV